MFLIIFLLNNRCWVQAYIATKLWRGYRSGILDCAIRNICHTNCFDASGNVLRKAVQALHKQQRSDSATIQFDQC